MTINIVKHQNISDDSKLHKPYGFKGATPGTMIVKPYNTTTGLVSDNPTWMKQRITYTHDVDVTPLTFTDGTNFILSNQIDLIQSVKSDKALQINEYSTFRSTLMFKLTHATNPTLYFQFNIEGFYSTDGSGVLSVCDNPKIEYNGTTAIYNTLDTISVSVSTIKVLFGVTILNSGDYNGYTINCKVITEILRFF